LRDQWGVVVLKDVDPMWFVCYYRDTVDHLEDDGGAGRLVPGSGRRLDLDKVTPSITAAGRCTPDDAALMRAMPSIAALPAVEGGALMWDQRLLHYGRGGAASPRSTTPRYSVSIEFEQARAGGERDARGSSPSKTERIMRISSLLDRFAHMCTSIDLEDPNHATELSEWRSFILRMRQTDDRIGELGELTHPPHHTRPLSHHP
jgi:hypothetical protein